MWIMNKVVNTIVTLLSNTIHCCLVHILCVSVYLQTRLYMYLTLNKPNKWTALFFIVVVCLDCEHCVYSAFIAILYYFIPFIVQKFYQFFSRTMCQISRAKKILYKYQNKATNSKFQCDFIAARTKKGSNLKPDHSKSKKVSKKFQ